MKGNVILCGSTNFVVVGFRRKLEEGMGNSIETLERAKGAKKDLPVSELSSAICQGQRRTWASKDIATGDRKEKGGYLIPFQKGGEWAWTQES